VVIREPKKFAAAEQAKKAQMLPDQKHLIGFRKDRHAGGLSFCGALVAIGT